MVYRLPWVHLAETTAAKIQVITDAVGEVVAFLSVGADKDKGVGASYQWVLVKQGGGAS